MARYQLELPGIHLPAIHLSEVAQQSLVTQLQAACFFYFAYYAYELLCPSQ